MLLVAGLTCGNSMGKIMNYFHLNFQEIELVHHSDYKKNFKMFVDKFVEYEEQIYEYFEVRESGEYKNARHELKHFVTDN